MTFIKYLKSKKFIFIIIGIWLIIGIVFIWLFISNSTQQGIQVDAYITSIVPEKYTNEDGSYYEYYAHIEYQVNGTTYTSKIQCRKSNYIGQKISIYYDPQNPTNTWKTQRNSLNSMFWILALPICLVSICIKYGTRKSIIFGEE